MRKSKHSKEIEFLLYMLLLKWESEGRQKVVDQFFANPRLTKEDREIAKDLIQQQWGMEVR